MRILAIDSSGLVATVAVVEEENEISKTIAEYTINYKKTHSQTLLPMIDEMVKMVEADLNTIDAIAVAGGPGSFTGLRIGSATAKGCVRQALDPYTDSRSDGIQYLRMRGYYMSDHGCKKKSGLYRNLLFCSEKGE